MASPLVIQHRLKTMKSDCRPFVSYTPPRTLPTGPSAHDELKARVKRASSKQVEGVRNDVIDMEGPLLQRVTGMKRLIRREWRESYFRLDSQRGVLELWRGSLPPCDPGQEVQPRHCFLLENLLAVAQPPASDARRRLVLIFQGFPWGQQVIDVSVPEGQDFYSWFTALARHAHATGDI